MVTFICIKSKFGIYFWIWFKWNLHFLADESESRRSPYEDDGDEQEDDNDTNVTDDEENGGDKTMEVS